jgi:hypothetical protein
MSRIAPQAVPDVFAAQGVTKAIRLVLEKTGKASKKKCPMNAILVVWLVVALSLHRSLSVPDVLKEVVKRLRRKVPGLSLRPVTKEAPVKARQRLGPVPLKELFEMLAQRVDPEPSFHGLRTWGVDGVRFTMPDTPENEAEFGRPGASRGKAAFPQMLGVALIDTVSRQIRDVVLGHHKGSERAGCQTLLQHLGPQDLLLLDRGFPSIELFEACVTQKFLARLSSNWKPRVLRRLGKGDSLVEVSGKVLLPEDQWLNGRRAYRKVVLILRVIEYRIRGRKHGRLITNLLDSKQYPPMELVVLYHERWECELAYDEVKTHLISTSGGSLDTIFRSKSPEAVLQEAYGMLVAYNLVRELMAEAARVHNLDPELISFVEALTVIRMAARELVGADPRAQRRLTRQLLADIADCKLSRSRRHRSCPRVVRVKMTKFPLKRKHHHEEPLNFLDLVSLGLGRRAA